MHIHRVIASGITVPGWVLPPTSGWVIEDSGDFVGTNHPVETEPIVRIEHDNGKKIYHVIPIDQRLMYPKPSEILSFDEKLLVPDSVKLVVSYGQAIAYGHSSSWTVVLYLNAAGMIKSWTVILQLSFLISSNDQAIAGDLLVRYYGPIEVLAPLKQQRQMMLKLISIPVRRKKMNLRQVSVVLVEEFQPVKEGSYPIQQSWKRSTV